MGIDRETLYAGIVARFGSDAMDPIRQGQPPRRDGFEAILNVWEAEYADRDPAWLAYILATAWHETARYMAPIREGRAATDERAFAIVQRHVQREGLRDYVSRKENGHSYYGRGFVQLTWDENYRAMGAELGMGDQLYDNPDLVMEPSIAAKIICRGMVKGLFRRRHTLERYLGNEHYDWHNARLIVNGRRSDGSIDKADEIAEHARKFYEAILPAIAAAPAPTPEPAPIPAPAPTPEPAPSAPSEPPSAPPQSQPTSPPTPETPTPQPAPPPRAPTQKPIGRSRTILAAIVAGLVALVEFVRASVREVAALFPVIDTPYGGFNTIWILAAVLLIALVVIIWARIDDRRKRGR
jgi:hypothetical protein